jgi:hypothetical protein
MSRHRNQSDKISLSQGRLMPHIIDGLLSTLLTAAGIANHLTHFSACT